MAGELILVLGGVRSGKSHFAEGLAAGLAESVLYVATASAAGDEELAHRIAAHRARRPPTWRTVEGLTEPAAAIQASEPGGRVALIDSLSMALANVLETGASRAEVAAWGARLVAELGVLVANHAWRIVVVSDEVGLGGVALTPLGRQFADALGDLNQALAAVAGRTYYVVAGLAVDWRALAQGHSGAAE